MWGTEAPRKRKEVKEHMEQQTNISAIDKALAAAKARRAAKEAAGALEPSASEARGTAAVAHVAPAFAAQQKKEALALARETARAAREAAREAKRSSRAPKGETHMKKVKRAEERLPSLSEAAQALFNQSTVSLPAAELSALALHIQHYNRARATERAVSAEVKVGTQVRIIGGDPRFVGKTGPITKVQRIRCFVEIPGREKPVYLFTSDVELFEDAQAEAQEAEAV